MKLINDLPEVFEQFAQQRQQSFLTVKEYKEKGIPIIGAYCTYFPKELAMAAGAQPIGLCSTSDETIPEAEKDLPKELCPLIKSSYGFAKTQKCPYFYFSDLVIGETTCDGKKKMYELMRSFKDVYVMKLPNAQDEKAKRSWRQEVEELKTYIEEKFEVQITDEKLREAVILNNRVNAALEQLSQVMVHDPAPIMGYDLFKVLYGSGYRFDRADLADELQAAYERIEKDYAAGKHIDRRPRILITGCPIGGVTEKVIRAVEDNGGVVVGFENCTGAKNYVNQVDEQAENILHALADRYLKIGCSVMSPNPNRFALLDSMIDSLQVDGVLEMTLQTCLTYNIETASVRQFVTGEKGIPYLKVETDYSQADIGQLSTRVSAFLEML